MTASRASAIAASLLLLGAASPPAPIQRIDLSSYAYAPSTIHLRAGAPVTLQFVNRSDGRHDFTARSFFASSRIVAGHAPGGKVDLKGGGTAAVTLIPAAGTYRVHCGRMFHKMLGMKGRIVVD